MDSNVTLTELLLSDFNKFSGYLSKLSIYQILIVVFIYAWWFLLIYGILNSEIELTSSKPFLSFVLSIYVVLSALHYCRIVIFIILVMGFIASVISEIIFATSLGRKIIDFSFKKVHATHRSMSFYVLHNTLVIFLISIIFIIKITLIILQIKIPILVYVFMAMTMIINLIGLLLGMEEESPFFISREVLHGGLKLLHAILTAIIAIIGVQLFFPIAGIILDITFLITLIFRSVQYFSIFFD